MAVKDRNEKTADELLVELILEWDLMSEDQRKSAQGQRILSEVQLIGITANYFGGYEGMRKLHDAAEARVDNSNQVGYWLNRMWDLIGSWLA